MNKLLRKSRMTRVINSARNFILLINHIYIYIIIINYMSLPSIIYKFYIAKILFI